ncbi:MAG: TonB-dependent receptor plug domain-containing protein [Sphingobium phenoxybenzoativorans]
MTYKSRLWGTVAALAFMGGGQAFAQEETPSDGVLVVTGTRGQPRTVTESAAPIDVVSGDQLEKMGGATSLRDVLTQLVPSFQAQTVASSSWDSLARPAGLRGLGGAHVLVLVNGKRRHNSALINLSSFSMSSGSNPVDLDLIPNGAIRSIEVLRDGASAQYGSDAIAGVINITLKEDDSGQLVLNAGQRYKWHDRSDGETYSFDLYKGFKLGDAGFLSLTVAGRDQSRTVRNSTHTEQLYFRVNGQPDPRETTVDRNWLVKGGLPRTSSINMIANAGYDFGGIEAYATGTLGYRDATIGQGFRKPNSNQNILQVHPDGFAPDYTLSEKDFQFLAGVRSEAGPWNWDLSSTFGRNFDKHGSQNSLNASLGPLSPTEFTTFTSAFNQWTTNFDVTRDLELGFAKPLTLAFGLEHRWENFKTVPKDEAAYRNGGYIYPANYGGLVGQAAQVGARGAITLHPSDAADLSRNSYAAYIDLATNITDPWFVNAAGRFEHYDDSSGDVFSGKLSTRYEIMDGVALRATVSNGFRAPSLSQIGFAQTSTQIFVVNGVIQPIDSKTVKTDSPVGIALGAQPLKPEKSLNLSAGLSLTPLPGFSVTADAYRIELRDRILLSSFLTGAGVNAILATNGFQPYSVRYFTNALDTNTQGVDVVATYNTRLGDLGSLRLSAAFNYNKTKIHKLAANPPQLSGLNVTMFNRQQQGFITDNTPTTKLVLSGDWSLGGLSVNLRETRYGKIDYIQSAAVNDQHFSAKWITDLDVSYKLTESTTVAVGANNLFNVYPDLMTLVNTIGTGNYAANSPFGFYGGYYYGRLSVKF